MKCSNTYILNLKVLWMLSSQWDLATFEQFTQNNLGLDPIKESGAKNRNWAELKHLNPEQSS